jgi:hypothetical protein
MDTQLFQHLQIVFVLGPILGLLLCGFLLSMRSESVSLSSPQGIKLFLGHLSRVLIRIFGYIAGLVAVQQLVGFPMGLAW